MDMSQHVKNVHPCLLGPIGNCNGQIVSIGAIIAGPTVIQEISVILSVGPNGAMDTMENQKSSIIQKASWFTSRRSKIFEFDYMLNERPLQAHNHRSIGSSTEAGGGWAGP